MNKWLSEHWGGIFWLIVIAIIVIALWPKYDGSVPQREYDGYDITVDKSGEVISKEGYYNDYTPGCSGC